MRIRLGNRSRAAAVLGALLLFGVPALRATLGAGGGARAGAGAGAGESAPQPGSELRGKVTQVKDGDSMVLRQGGENIGLRIFGVDCPERGMPFSARAKSFTTGLVGNRDVTVVVRDVDRYGRVVGDVKLDDGRSLARELLREGLAWYYRRYANDPEYEKLETEARAAKRGLWSEPNPIPPWKFRADKRGD